MEATAASLAILFSRLLPHVVQQAIREEFLRNALLGRLRPVRHVRHVDSLDPGQITCDNGAEVQTQPRFRLAVAAV